VTDALWLAAGTLAAIVALVWVLRPLFDRDSRVK
jgi:hypothetical protein